MGQEVNDPERSECYRGSSTLMRRDQTIALLGSVFLMAFVAAAEPPAPPTGSAAIYVSRQVLADKLTAAIAAPSDPAVSAIGVTDQYSIQEVHRGKAAPPAVHVGWTELHFILDGSATFTTGGKIVGSASSATIMGGVSRKVQKGDAVIVPPDTPHWYNQVDGSLTYLEVRFIAPAKIGLEKTKIEGTLYQ
jgi:mannose-6-phosphate isomerase-like protein (cupin superfamily)